jgi:hypothetical protein
MGGSEVLPRGSQRRERVLSAADGETYDRMEKEITDLTKEIDRLNRQAAIEAQLNQPTTSPLSNMPSAGGEKPERSRDALPISMPRTC